MKSNDIEGRMADAFSLDFPVTLSAIIREAAEGWLKANPDLASATLDREGDER